ncbi:hypothetical protein, partial [Actinomadura physcomitrii]|uniref:hypothetical protein n=1 Tax=Actinomadura physcomitrii TaxID=2650748 RepID=UPI001A9C6EF8
HRSSTPEPDHDLQRKRPVARPAIDRTVSATAFSRSRRDTQNNTYAAECGDGLRDVAELPEPD